MGQAQINVRTRACSRTSIARTKQAALTHNVRGKELKCIHDFSAADVQKFGEFLCFAFSWQISVEPRVHTVHPWRPGVVA